MQGEEYRMNPSTTQITGPVPAPGEDASDVDVSQIDALLALTPTERLLRHEQALELVRELRKAGRQLYGFDPRAVVAASRPRG
jgi:hypothetical protein